jgi:threonine/homoserine/homoserine lactone efflux protein
MRTIARAPLFVCRCRSRRDDLCERQLGDYITCRSIRIDLMDMTALLIFTGALVVGAASPGPGILALVARVIGGGIAGIVPFIVGLILGDLIWLAAAVLGLAVLAQTFHQVFVLMKFAGAAYLLYLALRMWTAPVETHDVAAVPRRRGVAGLFLAGLSVTLGNPKVVGFYLALLPNLIDLGRVGLFGYAELASLSIFVLSVVFGAYAVAAARARVLFRSTRATRILNRTGGALMAGAAVAVATK